MTPEGALVDTSARLLASARRGDRRALAALLGRMLPRLRRWTHGRVPSWTRGIIDTSDVVQDALLRTLGRGDRIEARSREALGAYLHEAVRNRIRDEHRRVARHGTPQAVPDDLVNDEPSPLAQAMANEDQARYREALARLSPRDQELIVAHVELEYSHEQLGCMLDRSPNAARMALRRAIERLAVEMRRR
jgi:RNA polymerase sigma factor (sigma-70 family)